MGVVCPEGIRALERNSYEAEEMVEPDGRDGGRHGDPVDRRPAGVEPREIDGL